MENRAGAKSMFANLMKRLLQDRRGATAVEYGMILAFIVIAIISAIVAVAQVTTGMWNDVNSKVEAVTPGH